MQIIYLKIEILLYSGFDLSFTCLWFLYLSQVFLLERKKQNELNIDVDYITWSAVLIFSTRLLPKYDSKDQ